MRLLLVLLRVVLVLRELHVYFIVFLRIVSIIIVISALFNKIVEASLMLRFLVHYPFSIHYF